MYDPKINYFANYFVPMCPLAVGRVARLHPVAEPAERSDAKKARVLVVSGFRSDFVRRSPSTSSVLSLSLCLSLSPFPQRYEQKSPVQRRGTSEYSARILLAFAEAALLYHLFPR